VRARPTEPERGEKRLAEVSAREEYDRARGQLWLEPGLLSWRQLATGCEVIRPVEGAPPDAECRLVISVPDTAWPAGSFSLIWGGIRLFGLDLDGPPHRPAGGRPVSTPHLQTVAADGSEYVSAVDLAQEAITGLEQGLRWFMRAAGVEWGFSWTDPPVQAALLGGRTQARGPGSRLAARRRRGSTGEGRR